MSYPKQQPASHNLPSTSDPAPLVSAVPPPPFPVRVAFALWLVAVAAGAFETLLVVGRMVADGSGSGAEIVMGVTVRLCIFTAAVITAVYMRRGRGWARIALALGLGVVGMASLVAGPIGRLLQGESVGTLLSQSNASDLLFGVSRALHVIAVLAALVCMFLPASNAYFRQKSATRFRSLAE
jgi:hypothetical protein